MTLFSRNRRHLAAIGYTRPPSLPRRVIVGALRLSAALTLGAAVAVPWWAGVVTLAGVVR